MLTKCENIDISAECVLEVNMSQSFNVCPHCGALSDASFVECENCEEEIG